MPRFLEGEALQASLWILDLARGPYHFRVSAAAGIHMDVLALQYQI